MPQGFILVVMIVLMLLAGALLGILFYQTKKKGQDRRQYPWRALMGWCFIWVLERLCVESFDFGRFRWLLPIIALVLSISWYVYIYYLLQQSPNRNSIEEKIQRMGNTE